MDTSSKALTTPRPQMWIPQIAAEVVASTTGHGLSIEHPRAIGRQLCVNRPHRRCEMKTLRIAALAVFTAFFVLLCPAIGRAESNTCTVSLTPSISSPQFVGQRVVWTTTATNCGDAPVYQYKVAFTSASSKFRVTRDFNLANTLAWGPMQEGSYAVMVTVKSGFDAADSTSGVVPFSIQPLVTGDQAALSPTLNPLVALYSAPACDNGSIYVRFRPVSDTNDLPWKSTNSQTCSSGQSRNFLIAR